MGMLGFMIFFTLMMLLVGGTVISLILIWMFSHRMRIRDPTNKQAYINDRWVFEKKDKETGILYWVNVPLGRKLRTPKPPAGAIDVGKRGRKYAECYQMSEDEFIWITDTGVGDAKGKEKEIIDSFQAYSVVQRDVMINQHKKAELITPKKWTDMVVPVVAMGSAAMIIVCLFIFWGDIAKPALESHSMALEVQKENVKITQQLASISCGKTVQEIQQKETDTVIVQHNETPPLELDT